MSHVPSGPEVDVLALRACDGDEVAFAALCRAFGGVIFNAVDRFYAPGLDRDDLMQEARLGLFSATRSFDATRPFAPLAATVVQRRVLDAVKTARRGKHRPLNDADRWDTPLGDGARDRTLAEITPGGVEPERQFERTEDMRAFVAAMGALVGLEARVALAVLDTGSLGAAAEIVGISYKSADNAMQRVRVKVAIALAA